MNLSKNRRVVFILATGGLLTLVMITLAFRPIRAAGPWYVAPGGDDGNDCLSPGTACATINGAITKASPGDTIYVGIGTYTSTGTEVVLLDKDVTLSGGWDGTFTTQSGTSTIDGGGLRRGMTVNHDVSAVVERFTVQNGSLTNPGGGISNSGTLTLNSCTVSGNTSYYWGGGIYNTGTLILNNSAVSGNSAYYAHGTGGGIRNLGTAILNNSSVSDNTANWEGGGINNSGTLTLNNSTVSGNTARSLIGGGIYSRGTLTLNNSTVSGNTTLEYGGGIYNDDGTATLQNSVLAGNTAGDGLDCWGTIGSLGYNLIGDTSGCTFTPGVGDLTNVSANLGLLIGSPSAPRYHPLLSSSPAIDAGDPAGCTDDVGNPLDTDQRGAPRVGRCDMGAYEYTVPGPAVSVYAFGGTPQHTPLFFAFDTPLQAAVLDNIGTPVSNNLVTFSAPASGAGGTFADSGTATTTAVTEEGGVATAATFTANGLAGSYAVTATASGIVTPATFLLTNVGWYVSLAGDDANDCQSPTTPCATVNGVLGKAGFSAGDTVLVASGTYTGTGDEVVLLDKGARLVGGWNGTFTTQGGTSAIDGEGARRGLTVNSGVTAIVERFAVHNGSTGSGGGIDNAGTLTLNNSTVSGNTASNGGGISTWSATLTLNNSTVSGNTASNGGGIYWGSGTLTLNNSTVSGNTASGDGSGIYNYNGNVTLNSSTVSGNTASKQGGGIYKGYGTVTLQNTILAGNTASGAGPDCSGTIGSAGYNLVGDTSGCTFTPGVGDLTNVSANLGLLIGAPGYHPLLTGSPAIDAVPLDHCTVVTDQRGVARPQGLACDMGAYEYTPPGPAASIHAFGGTPQRTPPLFAFDTPIQAAVLDDIGTPVGNTLVTFSAPASGASGTFADSGTFTTTAVTYEGGVAIAATFTANELAGNYVVTATAIGAVTPASFLLHNVGWYVSLAGDDANGCQSPTTPCATVNGVLGKAGFSAGDTVLVASGMYTGSGDEVLLLDKDVTLSGGWDGTFTTQSGISTIDGEGSRRGMTVNGGVTAIVECFTLQSGSADWPGGGGIYNNGTMTLNNSTVSGNTATANHGGGIYNGYDGTLALNNSTITGNAASYGGGISNSSTLTLNNSTVSGNAASYGGGIRNGGTLTLNNSTVSGNTAIIVGGIYSEGGTVSLKNTILAGNTASATEQDCSGNIASAGYNLIGNTIGCTLAPATGDLIDVDPRLISLFGLPGYHPLLPGSPAIDAGNPAGCTDHLGDPLTTDQRGTPRPLDGDGDGDAFCDMGSYEYDPEHPIVQVYLPVILRNH